LTAARDAAEAIEVEYDPLPAVTEAKDAISPGAPQLFDHIPSNIVFDWDNDMGDAKATDAAFSRASLAAPDLGPINRTSRRIRSGPARTRAASLSA
jgi:CO/xanthine dehydrogenase Mo-binding subunit